MTEQKKPTLLIILDGWGVAPPSNGNAVYLAKTPTMDRLFELYPSTTLGATGEDVGLNKNQMSGSESGHMNIGAGRIVKQDSKYITDSIRDGSFFMNPIIIGAINHTKKYKSKLHIMGLMGNSDSPHSNPEHFRAILKAAKKNGINEAYCHLFTDGRDSYPKSAFEHLKYFQRIMAEEKIGKVATIAGRFYAMDRAKNWKRLTLAYDAMVFGLGAKAAFPEDAIANGYKANLADEYFLPTVIVESERPVALIKESDAVIFFNFRSDRARQLTKLFIAINKERIINDDMPIIDKIKNLYFAALTNFGPDLDIHTAFSEKSISLTLPMMLGNLRQLYIAESEKFAHITYFLNGGYADAVSNEERVMIKSPNAYSYVSLPEMSAKTITEKVLTRLADNSNDFIAINYANADMIGHTGNLGATVRAIEFLDKQISALTKEVLRKNGHMVITADHGNADDMIDFESDQPNTFHTKNPVPFLLIGEKFKNVKIKENGVLANIAPTILDILNIEKPKAMKCDSLLN